MNNFQPSDKQSYEVGYGKPPGATKFKTGQSGNPKGRPKGVRNVLTAFREALSDKVTITENGRRRKVSKLEATAKQLANKAASGDARAILAVLNIAPLLDLVIEPAVSAQMVAEHDRLVMQQIFKRINVVETDGSDGKPSAATNEEPRS